MLDLNGSIESIMQECERIAFNEFKGEAEVAYANRRSNETQTHSHGYGKTFSRSGRNAVSNNNHNASYTPERLKGRNKEETRSNYNHQVAYHKLVADVENRDIDMYKDPVAHSIAKHNKKVNKESASIFDTLLDQV